MLDEAMALACGPADDTGTAAKSVCSFFTACYVAGDFERAGTWTDLLADRGLMAHGSRQGVPVRALRQRPGGTCWWRWAGGATPRRHSVASARFEAVMQMPSWHPDIALADLRIRQGRLHRRRAAARRQGPGRPQALLPAARPPPRPRRPRPGRAAARRGLRTMGDERLRAIELLFVVVDAELAAATWRRRAPPARSWPPAARSIELPAAGARAARPGRARRADRRSPERSTPLETAVDGSTPRDWPGHATCWSSSHGWRAGRRRPGAAGSTPRPRPPSAALDVVVAPDGAAARPARSRDRRSPMRPAGVATLAATASGGRRAAAHASAGGHQGLALPGRPDRPPGPSATPRPRRPGRGRRPERPRPPPWATPASCSTPRRHAYRHRIEALRAEADEAIESGGCSTRRRRSRTSSTSSSPSSPRRSASAAATGAPLRRRAGRLNVTRAVRAAIAKLTEALPEAGRGARPPRPDRAVLRVQPAGRRRRALDRSVLTERDGPR